MIEVRKFETFPAVNFPETVSRSKSKINRVYDAESEGIYIVLFIIKRNNYNCKL